MSGVTVDEAGDGRWVVRAERSLDEAQGSGEVTVSAGQPPDEGSPVARLAAARAWLALGSERLAAGAAGQALDAGRAGIEELGGDYAPDGVRDDTKLKLIAAEEQHDDGELEAAAEIVLDVLRVRSSLLVEREGASIDA